MTIGSTARTQTCSILCLLALSHAACGDDNGGGSTEVADAEASTHVHVDASTSDAATTDAHVGDHADGGSVHPTDGGDGSASDAHVSVDAGAEGAADGSTPVTAEVTLAFAHTVNGAAVTLGCPTPSAAKDAYPYQNGALHPFCVSRLRYFVSAVRLELAGGAEVDAQPGAHLVDLERPETLAYTLPESVQVGDVESLSFVMGLAEPLNHDITFTDAAELAMAWPAMMGGGYHYMQLEGSFEKADLTDRTFKAHTGYLCEDAANPVPLQCVDRSFVVTLAATGRSLPKAGAIFTVNMEISEWFKSPHTWDLTEKFASMPGMMMNATLQKELTENGVDVFALLP